jgi:hypothetical protein
MELLLEAVRLNECMGRARLVVVLLTVLATGACGGALPEGEPARNVEAPAAPADTGGSDTGVVAETGGSSPAVTTTVPSPVLPPEIAPPPIVLEAAGTRQEAWQGSYCVTKVDASGSGTGVCSDASLWHAEQLTVVRPGDGVRIGLAEGAFVYGHDGCTPECPPIVTAFPLGCQEGAVATFEVPEGKSAWVVELEPGAYELQVFGRFTAPDGRSGDTFGLLGLLVDPDGERAVIPVTDDLAVCPFEPAP